MGYYPNATIEALTATTFRAFFIRDFKYLPNYSATKQYLVGDQVYYPTTSAFYQCTVNSLGNLPTDTGYWDPISLDTSSYILDADLDKSYNQGRGAVNPEIFENTSVLSDAFYYAWAHYLVMDIRAAEGGIDSRFEGLISSKGVGGVSVGYSIPERFAKDPQFAYFAQTQYGQKYLSYVIPRITGVVKAVDGRTLK